MQHLVGLVRRPDAKDEDSLLVTENAVAALGSIAVSPALSAAVDRSQLLPLWLSHLPLKEVSCCTVWRLLAPFVQWIKKGSDRVGRIERLCDTNQSVNADLGGTTVSNGPWWTSLSITC